jgi:hypothetical protein
MGPTGGFDPLPPATVIGSSSRSTLEVATAPHPAAMTKSKKPPFDEARRRLPARAGRATAPDLRELAQAHGHPSTLGGGQ